MAPTTKARQRLPDIKAIAARAERARPKPARPSRQERAAETRRRVADEKRFRGLASGFMDVAAVEQLARQQEKADAQRAEAAHRRAIATSAQHAKWIASHTLPVSVLAPIEATGPFVIGMALFIRAWPNAGALRDSNIAAGNNSGEYRLDIDGDILDPADEARLSFYTLWQNRQDVDVTVRVASQLNVNAHVSAHADGRRFSSIFIPGASADASLRARLTLTPLWLQNTQFSAAEGLVGSVSARGGFFGDDDDATIFTSVSLDGSLPVTVPAGRFLMLETSLVTGWKIDAGRVRVDAEQGAFGVDVPFWIVTVLA